MVEAVLEDVLHSTTSSRAKNFKNRDVLVMIATPCNRRTQDSSFVILFLVSGLVTLSLTVLAAESEERSESVFIFWNLNWKHKSKILEHLGLEKIETYLNHPYLLLNNKPKWKETYTFLSYTVCLDQLGHRNGAVVSLFWEFWSLRQLLCHPKTGRTLLLGQKFTQMDFRICQKAGQQQRNNQDLVIWG